MSIERLIDLERYPLDALDTTRGAQLVAQCRHDLKEKALCLLPGFVHPQALEAMAGEATSLIPGAHYLDEVRNFSYDLDAAGKWPVGHPKGADIRSRYRQVLNEHILDDMRIREIYMWEPLTEFVRCAFGVETMFRSSCPDLSLTLKIADQGDTDGWHYDKNDGVVSLLLQQPDEGGQFEYAPYLRTPDDERYDDVARLFADPISRALRPSMAPGTFVLFNGNLSMHRVTSVGESAVPRIIALLSYDQRPDQVFSPWYCKYLREFPTDTGVSVTASTQA